MNDSTIRLSADTSALTESLSKIAEEMTAMKDAVSSSAAAMGANLDASAKQAEATNAAIHGLDDSVKTVTDSIQAQTKTVTDLGSEQSKVTYAKVRQFRFDRSGIPRGGYSVSAVHENNRYGKSPDRLCVSADACGLSV